MTLAERLSAQGLSGSPLKSAEEVTERILAVQAHKGLAEVKSQIRVRSAASAKAMKLNG